AHVNALLADGWTVCAVDRDAGALEKAAESAGDRFSMVAGDLREEATREKTIAHVLDRYDRIDGLINNAGYGLQRPLVEHSAGDLLDQLATAVEATLALSESFAPHLARRRGAIVNVSSTYALAGPCTYPNPPAVAYCAAKAAVIGLTRAMAHRFAPDVRVN